MKQIRQMSRMHLIESVFQRTDAETLKNIFEISGTLEWYINWDLAWDAAFVDDYCSAVHAMFPIGDARRLI
jgi:chitinase